MKFKYVLIYYGCDFIDVWHYCSLRELDKDLHDLYNVHLSQLKKYNKESNHKIEIIKVGEYINER